MTAPDLTEAERATVERFEQAPDALAEPALTLDQRHALQAAMFGPVHNGHLFVPGVCDDDSIDPRWCNVCGENRLPEVQTLVARMIAEAADAREAEVRARVAQAIEAHYLGADYGRNYDGTESRETALGHAHDEALQWAAHAARSATLAPTDSDDRGVLAPRCPRCVWQADPLPDTPSNQRQMVALVAAHKAECPAAPADNDGEAGRG